MIEERHWRFRHPPSIDFVGDRAHLNFNFIPSRLPCSKFSRRRTVFCFFRKREKRPRHFAVKRPERAEYHDIESSGRSLLYFGIEHSYVFESKHRHAIFQERASLAHALNERKMKIGKHDREGECRESPRPNRRRPALRSLIERHYLRLRRRLLDRKLLPPRASRFPSRAKDCPGYA